MAQYEYDLPDDYDEYDSNALTQVRRAHKAATKRIKELEQELDTFRVETRVRSVKEVLESRGYNPRIADLIPDSVTSADEISAWLEERSDVFQPVQAGSVASDDEQMQSFQSQAPQGQVRFNEVVNAGQAPAGDESQIMAMIAAAKSPEELNKLLFGNAAGPPAY